VETGGSSRISIEISSSSLSAAQTDAGLLSAVFLFSLSISVTDAINGHLYIKTLQTLYYEYLNLIIDDNTTTLI